jgi:hypothetical protein
MIAYFVIVSVVACFFESDATYIAYTTKLGHRQMEDKLHVARFQNFKKVQI